MDEAKTNYHLPFHFNYRHHFIHFHINKQEKHRNVWSLMMTNHLIFFIQELFPVHFRFLGVVVGENRIISF